MDNLFFCTRLRDAFATAGIKYPDREPEPGKMSRFPTNGTDRHDAAGWCKLFSDGTGAVFGDWRTGETFTWQCRDTNAPPPSQEDHLKARQMAQQQAEADRIDGYALAAGNCAADWDEFDPAPADHSYLNRKGITPHGARLDTAGRLVLPVFNAAGEIQSLQTIAADGVKRFHPGATTRGGRMFLGVPTDGSPIVLSEGFATAASIHEASGVVVAVGFSGGNLARVAADLRRQFPKSPLLVAGDRDAHGAGQKYAEAAAEAAESARVAFPVFRDGRPGGDFNDLAQAESPDAVRLQILAALAPASRFNLLSPADLANMPPVRWLVRDVLPLEGVTAIGGASGAGKSFVAIHLAGCIARGMDFFGYRVRQPVPVVYCVLEGVGGFAGRVAAWQVRHGALPDSFRVIMERFDLRRPAELDELVQAIRATGLSGGVLMVDTLAQSAPGMSENDSEDMGLAIASLQRLRDDLGGVVVAIHHLGKDASKGLRGHSSLHCALDAVLEVSREADLRTLKIGKGKDGPDGEQYPFRLEVVEIGTDDEDGEPITSCIVTPEESAADAVRRVRLPRGGNQRVIWDALGELFRESQNFGKGCAPASRPCLELEYAIERTRGRLTCANDQKTRSARNAITGLVNLGCLELRDCWIWTR